MWLRAVVRSSKGWDKLVGVTWSNRNFPDLLMLGHLTSRRSCPGAWLWAVSNFVAFCPDWPPAVGPKIHIFCSDRDQGFPAIAGGPMGTLPGPVIMVVGV
jgi:hypothetical protein